MTQELRKDNLNVHYKFNKSNVEKILLEMTSIESLDDFSEIKEGHTLQPLALKDPPTNQRR